MKKSNKPNSMIAQIEAKYERRFQARMTMLMQMGQDAAMIAANEVLQMGSGRAAAFNKAYIQAVNDMAHFIVDDQKDDKEFVYAKAKIDEKIKAIVGEENFLPWEERYYK